MQPKTCAFCCSASVASEQQHKQDLNRREYEFSVEFIAFYQNALHLTRVYCATFTRVVSCFVQQLTGKIENMKIGILKEGFGLKNSEADVHRTVREAAERLGCKCGAVVEEVSIPMHSDGNSIIMPSNL